MPNSQKDFFFSFDKPTVSLHSFKPFVVSHIPANPTSIAVILVVAKSSICLSGSNFECVGEMGSTTTEKRTSNYLMLKLGIQSVW